MCPPRIAPQKPCEQQGLAAPWNAAEPAQGPQGMEGLAGQTAVQDHGADEEGKQGRNHRPQTEGNAGAHPLRSGPGIQNQQQEEKQAPQDLPIFDFPFPSPQEEPMRTLGNSSVKRA